MKKFIPLTLKITVFSTTVILITGIIIAYSVYSITHAFFYRATLNNIQNETKLISNDIENVFIQIVNDVAILRKTPPIQGIVRSTANKGRDTIGNSTLAVWKDRLATIFSSMLEVNPNYTQIRYIGISNKGKELVRVDRTNREIFRVSESALQSKANEDYFKHSIKLAQGSVYFSDITYNRENNKIQYPLIATLRTIKPVYTSKQKIFGLLVININIIHFLREILIRDTSQYTVIIYNQYNDFFIYNPETKTLKFYDPNNQIKQPILGSTNIKSTKQIIPYLKNAKNRLTLFQPVYMSHHKDHQIYTLAISISKNIITAQDKILIRDNLVWVIFICLLASLLIFIYARLVMRNLTNMANSINKSALTDEQQEALPIHLNDEVGMLARAFEHKTKQLSKLALYDSLTGLPNRKRMVDRLEEAKQRAGRNSLQFALVYVDINDFKEVNDTYGHDYGDNLLIKFAHELQKSSRETDFCARIGGDEFAIIIEGIDKLEQLDTILNRYQSALNTSFIIKGVTINIMIAGGVSIYPVDAIDLDALLQHADTAMYQSKDLKIGQIKYFRQKDDGPLA